MSQAFYIAESILIDGGKGSTLHTVCLVLTLQDIEQMLQNE